MIQCGWHELYFLSIISLYYFVYILLLLAETEAPFLHNHILSLSLSFLLLSIFLPSIYLYHNLNQLSFYIYTRSTLATTLVNI